MDPCEVLPVCRLNAGALHCIVASVLHKADYLILSPDVENVS